MVVRNATLGVRSREAVQRAIAMARVDLRRA